MAHRIDDREPAIRFTIPARFSEPAPYIIGLDPNWQGRHLIPLVEAPDFMPLRNGKKYSRRAIQRWADEGRTAPSHPDGRCKLPTTDHMGISYTSAEDLEWFARMIKKPEGPLPASRQERMHRSLAARARMRMAGVKV